MLLYVQQLGMHKESATIESSRIYLYNGKDFYAYSEKLL